VSDFWCHPEIVFQLFLAACTKQLVILPDIANCFSLFHIILMYCCTLVCSTWLFF